MATPALIAQYDLDMGGMTVTVGFTEDQQLYTKILIVKKFTPLDSLSSITVKKAPLSSKLQLDIRISRGKGKERLFQSVQFDSADPLGRKFIEELKSRIPQACEWRDRIEEATGDLEDASLRRTYDLQIMWFIKAKLFAGHGRTMQIIMNYGMLCILTLLLSFPLLLYVIFTGCHRVTTDLNGLNIRKLRSKYFSWNEIDRIEASKYNIIITTNSVETDSVFLVDFVLYSRRGEQATFRIRSLEAKNFVREMINRGKIGEEWLEMFV